MSIEMSKNEVVNLSIEIIVKVVLLGIVLSWAFMILKPFIVLVIWAIIIAVALSPLIDRLAQRIPVRIKLEKLPEGVELRFGLTASVMVMEGTHQ